MGLEWWDGTLEGITIENWRKHRHYRNDTLRQKIRNCIFIWRAIDEVRQDIQEINDILYILETVKSNLIRPLNY